MRGRPGQGTFVIRALSGADSATQARFLAAMTDLLRSARSAGLGPDDVEAIYRAAARGCFAEGARIATMIMFLTGPIDHPS